jgi:ribonuclease BN (tRNA processing enzyme)
VYGVGPFRLVATRLPHFVPNVGVRIAGDGLVVHYATDTGPHASLAELGRDADLYVVCAGRAR